MRGGTAKAAEHGLGAGLSIGRQPRVIPLQMFEVRAESRRLPRQSADWLAMTFFFLTACTNKVVPRKFTPLEYSGGVLFLVKSEE